jgi:DNA modification methylase
MGIKAQHIESRYALYNADCMDVLPSLADDSVDLSIYSPPFATDRGGCLYTYSSNAEDLSNSLTQDEFFKHYEFIVRQMHRLTRPGRMSCVHSMDVAGGNTGCDRIYDFPGDIVRLHESIGFDFAMRFFIWKEPLTVRNRTMTKSLSHRGITEDSTHCSNAIADQLLVFRKRGENKMPVAHKNGLTSYAGSSVMPTDILAYKDWNGSQLENRFSHWIWRQYASSVWNDIRGCDGKQPVDSSIRAVGVLPHREAKEEEDERHVHPLQLDVIERACVLWSNPGEVVLSPFAGVGSEVFGAVINGRKGIGIELKPAYYHQAVKNLQYAAEHMQQAPDLFSQQEQERALFADVK